jgi:putative flippase GtrA
MLSTRRAEGLAQLVPTGFRFGLVGLVASGVHLAIASVAIAAGIAVLAANAVAFVIALGVSVCGHHAFSFRGRTTFWRGARRFGAGALVAFIANNFVLATLVAVTGESLAWMKVALAILVIPPLTFGYAHLFAYRELARSR